MLRAFAIALLFVCSVVPSARAQLSNSFVTTYTDWTNPYGNYRAVRATTHILRDPTLGNTDPNYTDIFWATVGNFNNGKGFYIGVQKHNALYPLDKTIRFSVWDATQASAAPNATCIPFGGEGVGQTCYVNFDWTQGDSIELIIEAGSTPGWWRGSFHRDGDPNPIPIGEIKAPDGVTGIQRISSNFTEYFGPYFPTCEVLPRALAAFDPPRYGSPVVATGMHAFNSVGQGHCKEQRQVFARPDGSHVHAFRVSDAHACELGQHTCSQYAVCTKDADPYACVCVEGYEGSGFACTPVAAPEPDAGTPGLDVPGDQNEPTLGAVPRPKAKSGCAITPPGGSNTPIPWLLLPFMALRIRARLR